jgi:hypothetical protein
MMAREVDPEGNRTIGVLTKIDIMDKGTNAMDMLMGKVVPLQMGAGGGGGGRIEIPSSCRDVTVHRCQASSV